MSMMLESLRERFESATDAEKAAFLRRFASVLDNPKVVAGETAEQRRAGDRLVADLQRLADALDGPRRAP